MAKRNARRNQPANRRRRAPVRVVARMPGIPALDGAAAQYARLLREPCTAPLVHPIFAGGEGGYLFRAESTFTLIADAGQTAGVLHWTPGAVGSDGLDVIGGSAATSGAAITVAALGASATYTPGYNFLANSSAVRCIAGAMQIAFVGTELNRSGRFHYGQTSGGLINVADTPSADSLAPILENWERTPTDIVQINWKPNIADTQWTDPGAATGAGFKSKMSSLTYAIAGLPAATGVFIRLTAVYEWKPAYATGLASASATKAISRSTLDNVLDYLTESGYNWARQTGYGIGNAAMTGMSAGAMYAINRAAANGGRVGGGRRTPLNLGN